MAQLVKDPPTMQEMEVQSLGWEDLLENEMATHSSIFAWEIPWAEEPGGLQSMGSQRVGHNLATQQQQKQYQGQHGTWLSVPYQRRASRPPMGLLFQPSSKPVCSRKTCLRPPALAGRESQSSSWHSPWVCFPW